MNRKLSAAILAIGFASAITAANAHPHLMAAGPAPGGVVKTSPKALRIQFNEGIVLGFSGVEITDASGKKQPIGKATLAPTDNKQLIVPLKTELASGKYNVTWHAVGDDTHKVQGRYSFEVKRRL
jgi:methionine-rich copper-binding protein CopC